MLGPLDGFEVDAVLDHVPQGGHLAELFDARHRLLDRHVHLLLRREAAEAVPDAGVRHLLVDAQRSARHEPAVGSLRAMVWSDHAGQQHHREHATGHDV